MSITITVPNDDHVALRAMAKALEEIAVARGAPAQDIKPEWMKTAEKNAQFWKKAATMLRADDVDGSIEIHGKRKEPEIDTASQQVESLSSIKPFEERLELLNNALSKETPESLAEKLQSYDPAPTTDSTGTPWDERIHSASKALNSDGTWRLRRKPADKTPEEWSAYVAWVEEDIHLVMSLQGETDEDDDKYSPDDLIVSVASASPDIEPYAVPEDEFITTTGFADEPSVTPAGDDFHVDAGEVTEQEVASIPVPPLPVPPVPQSTMSFPDVMKFLTERHARISNEQVTEIITAMGLKSIMDLNTHPEHTGPFIARVKALLGE